MNPEKIILASASPRHQELLRFIYPEFEVIPADVDETLPNGIDAKYAPVYLAEIKARAVCFEHPNALVIAADTVVICDREILGKPCDKADAERMLKALSGTTHSVITGCCIALKDKIKAFSVESLVTFYPLSTSEISEYIASGEPMDKAGAYGIQGAASLFTEKIEGDYFNIVGLPISRLNRELKNF